MAFLGRKQPSVDSVPQEVRDYYQTERRERAGVAWLLGLGTLLVTLILASGIYFGGRWAYRQFAHKKDTNVATTQSGNNDTKKTDTSKSSDDTSKKTDGTTNGGQTGTSSASTTTPSSSSSNSGSSSQPSSSTTSQPSTPTTPATNSSSSSSTPTTSTPAANSSSTTTTTSTTSSDRLANTGPGDTIAVFVFTTIAATIAYRMILVRRAQN